MKLICALAGTMLALSMTSVAMAQDSVTDAYGGQSTEIPSNVVTPESQTEAPTVAGATDENPAATSAPSAPSSGDTAPVAVAAPSASQPVSGSALPFTGLDVGLMALGGVLLLGFGLGMRRLSQRSAPVA